MSLYMLITELHYYFDNSIGTVNCLFRVISRFNAPEFGLCNHSVCWTWSKLSVSLLLR